MMRIQDYDHSWSEAFERIRASLLGILGPLVVRIDHIGSTSIPGMAAKGVIDVQVSVEALRSEVTERLVDSGYQHSPHLTQDHVPAG